MVNSLSSTARQRNDWWRPPAQPVEAAEDLAQRAAGSRAGLCELGVDLATPLFDDGQTLLMLAAEQGWTELFLGDAAEESGYTAVFYATRGGHLEILQLLLQAKASPNVASTRAGATPLLLAVMASEATSQPLVEALLEAKAEVAPMPKVQELRPAPGMWRLLADAMPKPRPPRRRRVAYDKDGSMR
eukprot:Skav206771  [mRNA]  locus=scaffold1823:9946:13218:- [translate_table: standard]